MHLFPQLLSFAWDFGRLQIRDELLGVGSRGTELLPALQTSSDIFRVKVQERILMELVTLIYFASTELVARLNGARELLILVALR